MLPLLLLLALLAPSIAMGQTVNIDSVKSRDAETGATTTLSTHLLGTCSINGVEVPCGAPRPFFRFNNVTSILTFG